MKNSVVHLNTSVQLYDLHPPLADFRAEVIQGLSQPQKAISPKFLYDKHGAELFDQICTLDEYYLTRTEIGILQTHAAEIAALIGDGVLIEFGSGSSQKIRILLDAMPNRPVYVGLDISKQHLQESCQNLVESYPGLEAIAICADYTQPLQLPDIPSLHNKYRVGFFPGSSIGNLEPAEAVQFLRNVANLLTDQGTSCTNSGLLLGVDLKKSPAILEPAYNDAQGISAAFALNLLDRMNRELGATFNLNDFGYHAFYNSLQGRIEMYIVSHKNQTVELGGIQIPFAAGERLRTEYSYKYSIAEVQALAEQAGFRPKQVWVDSAQLFSLHYLQLLA